MKRIIVVGGGFAGFWSAVSAARQLYEMKVDHVEVMLVNKDEFLGLRPRFYEKDPQVTRIPLKKLLDLADVRFIEGEVMDVDVNLQKVTVQRKGMITSFEFDRIILAAGSQLTRPNINGLAENAFSIDTYNEAIRLDKHLKGLTDLPAREGKYTAIIIGGGFTGLEAAAEMTARLQEIARKEKKEAEVQVIVIERNSTVAPQFSKAAQTIIEKALNDLNIKIISNHSVIEIDSAWVTLDTGEKVCCSTAIWTVGVKANPLTACFPAKKDVFGRLHVDPFLRVTELPTVYAAGDSACAKTDQEHLTMMSCQHAIPMGKFAGHNAVCNLLGLVGTPYQQADYVTCLDLGPWGALYTNGWDRDPVLHGEKAKELKQKINQMISPIVYGDRDTLFSAAQPIKTKIEI